MTADPNIDWPAEEPTFRAVDWKRETWLIIDTETTGVDIETANVVELGLVWMEQGRVIRHESHLVNPGEPIPPAASEIHGITDEMVSGAPTMAQLADKVLDAVSGVSVVCGYNALSYDFPLLRNLIGPALWDEAMRGAFPLDPIVAVRHVGRWWKGQGRHRLSSAASRLRLDYPEPGVVIQAHRATWDCVMAGRIAWEHVGFMSDDVETAWRQQDAEHARQRADFEAWLATQPKRA